MLRSMTARFARILKAEPPRRDVPQHSLAPLGRRRCARAIPSSFSSSCSDSSRSFRSPPAQVPHHRWETPRTRRVTVPRSKIGGNRNCRAQMPRRLQAVMSTGFQRLADAWEDCYCLEEKAREYPVASFTIYKHHKNFSSQMLDLHKNRYRRCPPERTMKRY